MSLLGENGAPTGRELCPYWERMLPLLRENSLPTGRENGVPIRRESVGSLLGEERTVSLLEWRIVSFLGEHGVPNWRKWCPY